MSEARLERRAREFGSKGETSMANVLGCILMAAITFPVSFFVARSCLRGVIRIVTGEENRDVL